MGKIIEPSRDCGKSAQADDNDAVRLRFWSGPMVTRRSADGETACVSQDLHYDVIDEGAEQC